MKQIRYTPEQRQAAVEQMGPPHHRPVKALAKATGITEVTLRTWRREAIEAGQLLRRDPRQSERWSGLDKFRMVLDTAPMSATELAEYARKHGVLPEQIARWRQACEKANAPVSGAPVKPVADAASRERVQAHDVSLGSPPHHAAHRRIGGRRRTVDARLRRAHRDPAHAAALATDACRSAPSCTASSACQRTQ